MTTEIRDYGDGKTIVVYSDERELVTKLSNLKSCQKIVPYTQDQSSKKKVALIGVDLYFPKRRLKTLFRKLGIAPQPLRFFEDLQS